MLQQMHCVLIKLSTTGAYHSLFHWMFHCSLFLAALWISDFMCLTINFNRSVPSALTPCAIGTCGVSQLSVTLLQRAIQISDEVLLEMAQMKLICKIMMICVRDQAKHHKMVLSWFWCLLVLLVQDCNWKDLNGMYWWGMFYHQRAGGEIPQCFIW